MNTKYIRRISVQSNFHTQADITTPYVQILPVALSVPSPSPFQYN